MISFFCVPLGRVPLPRRLFTIEERLIIMSKNDEKNEKKIVIYDTFKKEIIEVIRGDCLTELGFDKWRLDDLIKGKNRFIMNRYIRPEDKDKLKTLINRETKQEYECCSPVGFLIQLGVGKGTIPEQNRVSHLMQALIFQTHIRADYFENKEEKIKKDRNLQNKTDIILYDVFEEKTLTLTRLNITKQARALGFDYTLIYKLGRISKSINDRFILPEAKSEIFTLIDINTGQEFNCITNASLFVQLGQPQNDNYSKYIYAMKLGRQKTANIYGRTFELKNPNIPTNSGVDRNYNREDYAREREKLKTSHKIRTALRNRLRSALLYRSKKKLAHTFDLAGCSISFLIGHLEARFQSGMSWENYGLWEIDHIKPVASFPLDTEESQRECCHYTNLQPLWAEENGSKNDKSPEEWEVYKAGKLKREVKTFSYVLAGGS